MDLVMNVVNVTITLTGIFGFIAVSMWLADGDVVGDTKRFMQNYGGIIIMILGGIMVVLVLAKLGGGSNKLNLGVECVRC